MIISLKERIAGIDPPVRTITAAEAAAELSNNQGITFDIREPEEQDTVPTPRIRRVPRGMLEIRVPELCPDPDTPIYLHCASGMRAQLGAEQLRKMGYSRVTAIAGDANSVYMLLSQPHDNSTR